MSRPSRAKYCPQCHAMNFVEASVCVYCAHQFRTGNSSPTSGDANLHRTQMFMLPPLAAKDTPELPPNSIRSRLRVLDLFRSSPLLPMVVLLAVIVLALLALAVTTFR